MAKANVQPKSFQYSGTSKSSMTEKTVPVRQELRSRHSYLISDLTVIAIISIPVVLAMIIAHIFFS